MTMMFPLGLLAQDAAAPPPAPQVPATPAQQEAPAQTAPMQTPATFDLTGSARSGKTPLPGATVTAANTLTGKKYVAATNSEGKFSLSGMTRGRYVVRIEFMGFALFTQEVVLNPENPAANVDAELILASRQQQSSGNAMAAAGRGFQSLAMEDTLSALSGGNGGVCGGNGGGGGQGSGAGGRLSVNRGGSGRANGIGEHQRRARTNIGFRLVQ